MMHTIVKQKQMFFAVFNPYQSFSLCIILAILSSLIETIIEIALGLLFYTYGKNPCNLSLEFVPGIYRMARSDFLTKCTHTSNPNKSLSVQEKLSGIRLGPMVLPNEKQLRKPYLYPLHWRSVKTNMSNLKYCISKKCIVKLIKIIFVASIVGYHFYYINISS